DRGPRLSAPPCPIRPRWRFRLTRQRRDACRAPRRGRGPRHHGITAAQPCRPRFRTRRRLAAGTRRDLRGWQLPWPAPQSFDPAPHSRPFTRPTNDVLFWVASQPLLPLTRRLGPRRRARIPRCFDKAPAGCEDALTEGLALDRSCKPKAADAK